MVVTKNICVRMRKFLFTSATIGILCLVYSNISGNCTEKILFKVGSQENLRIQTEIFFCHNAGNVYTGCNRYAGTKLNHAYKN